MNEKKISKKDISINLVVTWKWLHLYSLKLIIRTFFAHLLCKYSAFHFKFSEILRLKKDNFSTYCQSLFHWNFYKLRETRKNPLKSLFQKIDPKTIFSLPYMINRKIWIVSTRLSEHLFAARHLNKLETANISIYKQIKSNIYSIIQYFPRKKQ